MDAIRLAADCDVSCSFNPRARDGRDKARCLRYSLAQVSIHAPVMDAMFKSI